MAYLRTFKAVMDENITLDSGSEINLSENSDGTIRVEIDNEINATAAQELSEIFAELASILKQQESA